MLRKGQLLVKLGHYHAEPHEAEATPEANNVRTETPYDLGLECERGSDPGQRRAAAMRARACVGGREGDGVQALSACLCSFVCLSVSDRVS